MWSCFDPWRTGAAALDVTSAARGSRERLLQRQQHRLAALLHAASASPLYRQRLGRRTGASLDGIAPVGKRELMQRFAEWVTDPSLRLSRLRAFLADPSNIGEAFDGRFIVWESSGSSGEPGVFVQDARAMAVYDALEACRRAPGWMDWWSAEGIAFVGAIGHFASHVSVQRLRRLNPLLAPRLSSHSFLQPVEALVDQLNAVAPAVVATYPTAAVLLAEEAAAGRLRIAPREVWTGGETLTAGMRRRIAQGLGCGVVNSYGASEFLPLASQCRCGALHLNIDWVILEPVDEHLRPLPAGVTSHSSLLTNLANHVQPLIRYELGDRIRLHEAPCECGSPLPAIDVEGRSDDMLLLRDAHGHAVRLLPLALTTVLEDGAGVFDFQLVQHGPSRLSLHVGGGEGAAAATRARTALLNHLRLHGLGKVQVEAHHATTLARGRSGKLQRIVQAPAPLDTMPVA